MAREAYRIEPGTGLAYLQRGRESAPLVVLLHGFPDIPESWLPVMERLAADGWRAVAPALPGYRPSPDPPSFDLGTLSAIVTRFAQGLQAAPFALVGHDWGAAITHDAVGSGSVQAAVTLSVPHPLTFLAHTATHPGQLWRSRYMGFFQLPRLPEHVVERGYVRALWKRWSVGFDPPEAHLVAVEARIVASLPGPLAYYRAMFRPAGIFVRRALAMSPSSVPVLHLHGQHDRCITPDVAAGQRRWFTGPHETRFVPGGHFLPTEVPDAIAAQILEWLGRFAQTPTSGS